MKACLGFTVQIQKSQRNSFQQMTNGNFDNYNVDNDDCFETNGMNFRLIEFMEQNIGKHGKYAIKIEFLFSKYWK